jgi:hypothetical protein
MSADKGVSFAAAACAERSLSDLHNLQLKPVLLVGAYSNQSSANLQCFDMLGVAISHALDITIPLAGNHAPR